MTSAKLTEDIVLAATELGARLFRNNSGVARFTKGGVKHVVPYGVGPVGGGGSDLIGWTKDGLFLSIEVKFGKDRPRENQLMWIDWVNKGGGRAGIARSVEDAIRIIKGPE